MRRNNFSFISFGSICLPHFSGRSTDPFPFRTGRMNAEGKLPGSSRGFLFWCDGPLNIEFNAYFSRPASWSVEYAFMMLVEVWIWISGETTIWSFFKGCLEISILSSSLAPSYYTGSGAAKWNRAMASGLWRAIVHLHPCYTLLPVSTPIPLRMDSIEIRAQLG